MNPSLFLAAVCLGIASAVPKFDSTLDTHWYRWKATHRRLYRAVGNIRNCPDGPLREGPLLLGVYSREYLLKFSFYQGNNLTAAITEPNVGRYYCVGTWRTAPRSIKPSLAMVSLLLVCKSTR